MAFARVQHGLDGEDHAGFQLQALARITVVQDLRLIVIHLADAVPAVLANHAEAVAFGNGLNRMTNVAQRGAGTHRTDAGAHGLVSGLDQPPRLRARLADKVHAAGVAKPAVFDDGDVDIHDVAILKHPARRDAVADHFVDRSTHGFREAVITDVTGNGLLHIDDVVVAELVEVVGGDPRLDMRRNHRQHLGSQFASNARLRYLRRRIYWGVRFHDLAPATA